MTSQSGSTTDTHTLGRIGYDAYGTHPSAYGPWTTFDGRLMPRWEEYSAAGPESSGAFTQERWEQAAAAIIAEYERRKRAAPPAEDLRDEPAGDGPTASMTLTAWTPEAGAAVINLAQGRASELRPSPGVPLVDTINISSEGQIDPFLMGLSEIASATRDLAEASKAVNPSDTDVIDLISDVTKALHSRVKALVSPSGESTAKA